MTVSDMVFARLVSPFGVPFVFDGFPRPVTIIVSGFAIRVRRFFEQPSRSFDAVCGVRQDSTFHPRRRRSVSGAPVFRPFRFFLP
jgi:hypothetical protein